MTSILRQSGRFAGISKSVLRNTTRRSIRPSILSISHQSSLRSRHYATNEPQKPKNENDEELKKDSRPPGANEELKNDSNHQPKLAPGMEKLSPEHLKALERMKEQLRNTLSEAQFKKVEHSFESIKKYGISSELRESLDAYRSGQQLSLITVMRLTKNTIRYAAQVARLEGQDGEQAMLKKMKAETDELRKKMHDSRKESTRRGWTAGCVQSGEVMSS